MLTCLLCLGGCQHDPWADDFLIGDAVEKDIVGSYGIDAESPKRVAGVRLEDGAPLPMSAGARIELRADHSANFVDVPVEKYGHGCLAKGRGSWRVNKSDGFTILDVAIVDSCAGGEPGAAFGYELVLYGSRPPYKLHLTIGDPDAGDAVQFEKRR